MQINSFLKIAVTGANGQLGRKVVEQLTETVNLRAYGRVDLDISDERQVNEILGDFDPDIIINAAAYTAVDKAEVETKLADKQNHQAPMYLAKIAEKLNAVLIHVSTDYVFDGLQNKPYTENDIPAPKNVYGNSKLKGELAVQTFCKKHIIIRTSWVFSEYGNNFVKTMLRLAEQKNELSVVADQVGGPTYAGDIAAAIKNIINKIGTSTSIPWGIYHYCGSPYVNWFEFSETIFRAAIDQKVITKAPILKAIKTESYPTPAKRPAFSKLDCSKIASVFDISVSDWQSALNNLTAYK
jgi:dTDP-4-dehydrorhamnose reductase